MQLQTIKNAHFVNDRSADVTFTFEDSIVYTTSTGWTKTTSNAWHVGEKVEVEAEINIIAAIDKVTVGQDFFWEKKEKTTLGGETSTISETPLYMLRLQYSLYEHPC
jgi:hypothetical protein